MQANNSNINPDENSSMKEEVFIEDDVDTLQNESHLETEFSKELEKLRKENTELRDSWQRERAEFMNFRKRVAQERLKQIEDTKSYFFTDLLPVLDNLYQVLSIESHNEEVKKYVQGVSMIRDNFISSLNKHNIKQHLPMGEDFDPIQMEAIATETGTEFQKEVVIEVYQAGYYIQNEEGSRHNIRAARVKVGRPASH